MSQFNSQTDPQESDVTKEKKSSYSFPIPIAVDPVRILGGILTRWYWLVLGGLIFGAIGALVGSKLNKQTFSLSTALIKRKVPQTVQTSEIGQPFRPADFNDATLLSTLLATEPLDWATKRIENGLTGVDITSKVEASQLENTDIYYITYHSPFSGEDAVKFIGVWSEEILEYTQRLQQSEARIIRDILEKEVRQLEFRIDQLDQRIIDFAKKNNFIGGDSQVAAILGKISQIDLNLQDAEAQKTSLLEQIAAYRKKIQHHSPLEIRLREAEQELANLRSTYTDLNPLVMSKLESISYFENQINDLANVDDSALEQFTGTDLGNTLYLNIIGTHNNLTDAENRIISLRAQRKIEQERLNKFPGIIAQHNALVSKKESLLSEASLLSKRLKETEIFASSSPGYFQIFEEPDIRKVMPSSLTTKPLLLGVAGLFMGAGIAMVITMLMTQRTSRRSVLECCATTGARFVADFPEGDSEAPMYEDFWIKRMATKPFGHPPVLFWTAALTPEDEEVFWAGLSKSSEEDTGKRLKVYDLTPECSLDGDQKKNSLADWVTKDTESRIWRAHTLPHRDQRELLKSVEDCYALIKTEKASIKAFRKTRELFEIYLPPCYGTLTTYTPAIGKFRVHADQLSMLITKQLS
ncbi:GumC family protein [Rubritalea marina]|uniref:GumC family protein n=1 Tax=Rubritalea marina TaxID=361055 RepID=UPI00037DF97D|nr:hypothetical protein [Rubritalea marina]